MRRFEESALLSNIALKTGVSNDLARALADVVYEAHECAELVSRLRVSAHARTRDIDFAGLCNSGIACPSLGRARPRAG